jgi:hypothetical protein
MWGQRLMWIAWPAFLVAAALEMLVFAFIDPTELHLPGAMMGWSREAIYTACFFVFWGGTLVSSGLTTLLSMSPFEVNRCPVPPDQRPADCAKNGGTTTGCPPAGCAGCR